MTAITFHPEAAAAIDRRAGELLQALRPAAPGELGSEARPFRPDTLPRGVFTEKDILGPIEMERINVAQGTVELVAIETATGVMVLDAASALRLDELTSQVLKSTKIRDRISRKFVRDAAKRWLREKSHGATTDAFSEAL